MSRIGKKPILIPQGVNIDIKNNIIKVKGQKGELSYQFPIMIKVSNSEGNLIVERMSELKTDKSLHGLVRNLIANMIIGVSEGYSKVLFITGIGYKSQIKGNKLVFILGYSHPVEYELPKDIKAIIDAKQTTITLTGFDKQLLGRVASEIRAIKVPDAYKGKGVRYANERIKLKAGKTGKK